MDVRCGRCRTEYEFDDALISERGTTVKCTNCGYQFKVFPPQSGAAAPERWVVRTASGRELVYTSLRELQKGIAQRHVGSGDLLSRGNQPPRPLSSIAELEPFFAAGGEPQPARRSRTIHGVAPPANPAASGPVSDPVARGAPAPLDGPSFERPPPSEDSQTVRQAAGTTEDSLTVRLPGSEDSKTVRLPSTPPPPPAAASEQSPSSFSAASSASAPEPVPAAAMPQVPEVPNMARESFRSYEEIHIDPRLVHGPPSRRARSRWIAGLVIMGVLALFAITLGRAYISRFTSPKPADGKASDARVAAMLERGLRLLEEGDLEGSKEEFDKASVLAEADPALLVALARLETTRADLLWLKLRLLDPNDQDSVKDTHRQLGLRVGRARESIERAAVHAPSNTRLVRARVDVLRLGGELQKARSSLAPLSDNAREPENAYVLAMIDVAEPSPVWTRIIDRLRSAAAAERDLGRARAALVYALARSGAIQQARSELEKIEARSKPHPLLPELQSFVRRYAVAADSGAAAEVELAAIDPSTLPKLDTSPGKAHEDEPRAAAGDFRAQLEQAGLALKGGKLDKAEQLFKAVLAQQPKNNEALAGLGDVARQRRDPATAEKMYERVLKENPTYLPALIASADQKWDSGDKKGAIVLYRRVLEHAEAGAPYAQRARSRIAQGDHAPAAAASASPSGSAAEEGSPPVEDKPEAPREDTPAIDTSDLPEMNK